MVRWTLFLCIVLIVLVVCLVLHELDAIIHSKIQKIQQEKFVAADVFISSSHLVEGEGIELSRFVLFARHTPESSENYPAVLEANRVLLQCPTQLQKLATQEVPIEKIIFEAATIRTYRRPDGSWSLGALKTNPEMVSPFPPPVIQFRNSTIELHDMTDFQQERKLVLRNVELTIQQPEETPQNAQGNTVSGEVYKTLPFTGSADCEYSRRITFHGRYYPEEGEIRVDANVESLQFSKNFLQCVPVEVARRLEGIQTVQGEITTRAIVAASLKDFSQAQFYLDGTFRDGQADDPRLPQPVTHITTSFQIANDGYRFPDLQLHYGQGKSSLSVIQWGYGEKAPRNISARIRQLDLTRETISTLPEGIQHFLQKIRPTGQMDMDGTFRFDGTHWTTSGNILCREMSLQYEQFPYRIEKLGGEIQLKGEEIAFRLQTRDRGIRLDGAFWLPSQRLPQKPMRGKVKIQAMNLPIEERLLVACPAKTQDFLRSLELSGAIHVFVEETFEYPFTPQSRDSRITIQLLKNACRYRLFPYPLRNIQGTIEIVNNRLTTRNLRGDNNQAEVSVLCQATTDLENPTLQLQISGKKVLLDEEFYSKLPPDVTGLFRYIRPQGSVDVHYEYRSEKGRREHLGVEVATSEKGITVTLPEVPYRLENFQGKFVYRNGQISLPHFKAENDLAKISGSLRGEVISPHQWECHLSDLTIDGIRFDRELLAAIPGGMRTMLASKRPDGFLFYRGVLDVHYNSQRERPFALSWNGELGLNQASFDFGVRLTNITGGIQLQGSWDNQDLRCHGELQIDSLFYQNLQFTNVRGPLWIDNQHITLGDEAEKRRSMETSPEFASDRKKRSLSAQVVGGELFGNFRLLFGEPSTFQLEAVLTRAKLEACSYLTGNNQLKGDIMAVLKLQGSEASLYSLRGNGEFHLTNADIYELTVMMSLLKILSLKEVNRTAFSSGDMRFRIEGNHIYFDQIDFYGDAFSLIGKGEMNFRQQVQLIFYTVVGRGETNIPILSPLLHATGRQMMMVMMKGPLQNPEITQRPLPGLNMALQQMEQDFLPSTPPPRSSRPGF
ncbi:MAG: hypothetical protein Q4D62_07675 [Planctomycetia bacterium]|nr:hypothetical protein [Planctomycetia bacterium]